MRLLLTLFMTLASINFAAADSPSAAELVRRIGRGVNILYQDPIFSNPEKARFNLDDLKTIREGGFQSVRVNLSAFSSMDKNNRIDPDWLKVLDDVVDKATKAGLMVFLDEHEYRFCGVDAEACRAKLMPFWSQIALRYKDAPSSVLFEILNEPDRAITTKKWNEMLREALQIIRKSNPTRGVVIGPAKSNGFDGVDSLSLPVDDRNIILTVHYYIPLDFTHQGANWTHPSREKLRGVKWGTDADRQRVERDFAKVAKWARDRDRPVLLGEFGTLEKGDLPSRVAWTTAVAREAEQHGFAWTYWQFQGNFNAYDPRKRKWIDPIYRALMPREDTEPTD